jgi:hypothetical protein
MLLVVNIALILVTYVAVLLVDCTFSAWISPLQSQAYKVMSKQKQLSNASNPEYVGSRFF